MYTHVAVAGIAASLFAFASYAPRTAAQSEREAVEQQRQAELQARQAELEAREAPRQREREALAAQLEAQQQREQEARANELEARERLRAVENEARQAERERAAERRALEQDFVRARAELERAAQNVARLSAQYAQPFAENMTRHWQSFGRRALLGLSPEDTELGVRVAGVSPGGPAAEAGLEVGDIITEIDGAALAAADSDRSPTEVLLGAMGNVEPGESVTLKLRRDGGDREVTLQTRENNAFFYRFGDLQSNVPALQRMYGMFGANSWADMQLVSLTRDLGAYFGTETGILVVRAPANDALGLRDGDVILDVGGRVPSSPEHAIRILASFEEGETLRIDVMRQQRRQTLELAVPAR